MLRHLDAERGEGKHPFCVEGAHGVSDLDSDVSPCGPEQVTSLLGCLLSQAPGAAKASRPKLSISRYYFRHCLRTAGPTPLAQSSSPPTDGETEAQRC